MASPAEPVPSESLRRLLNTKPRLCLRVWKMVITSQVCSGGGHASPGGGRSHQESGSHERQMRIAPVGKAVTGRINEVTLQPRPNSMTTEDALIQPVDYRFCTANAMLYSWDGTPIFRILTAQIDHWGLLLQQFIWNCYLRKQGLVNSTWAVEANQLTLFWWQ